jgi:molecular chaperone HtpG
MSETYAFQAEINQLLSLIINAFYSNKDVFLRELVSNASDALDKIRHKSLIDGTGVPEDLKIQIIPDKENKTLTIIDTGIGMTKEELVKNLGTIAHSGTRAFMEALKGGATANDLSLIGQFGMGFYSGYLVSDKVQVFSNQHVWESAATGTFTVTEAEAVERGAKLVLHLKDDCLEYLEEHRLKEIVGKHSQFINYPIELRTEREAEEEVTEPEAVEQQEEGKVEETEGNEVNEVKKVMVKKVEWQVLNKQKPLWTRPAEEVTPEEYAAFYKSVFNDWEDHLAVKHFAVEGQLEFKSLLFIPRRAPFDMFDTTKKQNNLKLYVRRVFIMDNCEELCPSYLSFVKGVIDTNDLPLNVSREMLQSNSVIKVIRKNVVKKCIEMMNELAENKDDYKTFYDAFGKNLKLGIHEDTANRDKLAALLRFASTKTEPEEQTSLNDYVTRMKEGQEDIYYITGESRKAVEDSPFLEGLKKKGYEVLFMVDPIDEYMLQQLREYEGKKLVCCSKEGLKLGEEDADRKEKCKTMCASIKEVLADKVQDVVVSERAIDAPCVLVTPQYGWTANMERIMKAQALRSSDMFGFMAGKRILEINPDHKIIQELKQRLESEDASAKKSTDGLIHLLFDTSLLNSGFSLEEPSKYAKSIFAVIESSLNLEEEATTPEPVVEETKEPVASMEELD